MQKRNYEVEVLVNGHPVKEYYKDGSVYIEGRKGVKFSIKIKNNGYSRILAIPTIDGLSVMNGKDANYDSPGYIINGYDSITIDGWRTSDKEVAEFYFSSQKDSYRKRIGKNGNLGIIGVAIFREKPSYCAGATITLPTIPIPYHSYPNYPWDSPNYPWSYPWDDNIYWGGGATYTTTTPAISCLTADATGAGVNVTGSAKAMSMQDTCAASSDLGTGFGEQKRSEVMKVDFDRESSPDSKFEIFYNTKRQLEKLGIDFDIKPKYIVPQAFPGEYCESPK